MKIVIALGGNAILSKKDKPTIKAQEKNIKKAVVSLVEIASKNETVITHGNGPQSGYLMLQQKDTPLDVIDAETEGQIGYLIQQSLSNSFKKNKIKKMIITLLTQVLVDKKDKGFKNPSKFVGPFYKSQVKGHKMKKDPRGGWRRVVASPEPIEIIEAETIKDLVRRGCVVIAAGGGGIPVVRKGKTLEGVEAVIDKDLASACLGNSIKAETLLIITDVPKAYLNYKQKNQKAIDKISVKEIKKHYKERHFPEGNMGPKIKAAINFIENGGKKAIITDIANIDKAMKGKGGTIIEK